MYAYQNNYPPTKIGNGAATRIYRNAADETIRIDEIGVTFISRQQRQLSPSHDNAFVVSHERTLRVTRFHPGTSSDRTVASIVLMGDYSSVEESGGNFISATWNIGDACPEVMMTDLPDVGDAV